MKFTAGVMLLLAFAGLLADYPASFASYPEYIDELKDQWADYYTSAEHYPEYDYGGFSNLLAEYPAAYESDAEYGDKYEGDLILSIEQMMCINFDSKNTTSKSFRWPHGRVFYKIHDSHFDPEQRSYILLAMQQIEEVSCIRFYEANQNDQQYINITGFEDNCYAQVGRVGDAQPLNLDPHALDTGCFRLGTILHEFLHALGFFHQHNASDRDEFITIVEKNVQQDRTENFKRYKTSFVEDFGVMYDYGSVLHFHSTAFSNSGRPTIIPVSSTEEIGQREGMSTKDIVKLNMMYECSIPSEKLDQFAMVLCEKHNKKCNK